MLVGGRSRSTLPEDYLPWSLLRKEQQMIHFERQVKPRVCVHVERSQTATYKFAQPMWKCPGLGWIMWVLLTWLRIYCSAHILNLRKWPGWQSSPKPSWPGHIPTLHRNEETLEAKLDMTFGMNILSRTFLFHDVWGSLNRKAAIVKVQLPLVRTLARSTSSGVMF